MRFVIVVLGLSCLSAPAARAADPKCGAHQHVAVEKDEDEGGMVKHCVCDDGWNANGPAPPCKKAKPTKAAGKSAQ
jgi:hypothetical protein